MTRDPEEDQSAGAKVICSKCQMEFEATEEGRQQFHLHLLDCGGVNDVLENGKKKKKKKRGMGGGLKSTVRMLKKTLDDKDEKGTDTGKVNNPWKFLYLTFSRYRRTITEEESENQLQASPASRASDPDTSEDHEVQGDHEEGGKEAGGQGAAGEGSGGESEESEDQ